MDEYNREEGGKFGRRRVEEKKEVAVSSFLWLSFFFQPSYFPPRRRHSPLRDDADITNAEAEASTVIKVTSKYLIILSIFIPSLTICKSLFSYLSKG